MERASGVLMPVSSLPGPYGIGGFGWNAYDFVDFLASCKQHYWQILPLTTTSYGDSPYQSFSARAGNPNFIDFAELIEAGYLEQRDIDGVYLGSDPSNVDYGAIFGWPPPDPRPRRRALRRRISQPISTTLSRQTRTGSFPTASL